MKIFLFLLSADNLCKQFGPRSGLTFCWSWSGSKLFDTLIVFKKYFFENVNFEKSLQTSTKDFSRLLITFANKLDRDQHMIGFWSLSGTKLYDTR